MPKKRITSKASSSRPAKPTATELTAALGKTRPAWDDLVARLSDDFPGLREEWKPVKIPFGRVCLLKDKDRTLLYLLPGVDSFEVSIVLGERAVALALAGDLSKPTRKIVEEALVYVEGRSVRLPVSSAKQIDDIRKLVASKVAPK